MKRGKGVVVAGGGAQQFKISSSNAGMSDGALQLVMFGDKTVHCARNMRLEL